MKTQKNLLDFTGRPIISVDSRESLQLLVNPFRKATCKRINGEKEQMQF